MNMKMITKILTLIYAIQTPFVFANDPNSNRLKTHKKLMSDLVTVYDLSSRDLQNLGLKAFADRYEKTFSSQDREFLSTILKGLKPLPQISLKEDTRIEINTLVNGKPHKIQIEIADANKNVFFVNKSIIKISESDSLEDVYKKVQPLLSNTKSAQSSPKHLINGLLFKTAHAIETSTMIVGSIIAISVAIILYRLGKNAGEEKQKDKQKNSGNTNDSDTGTISEENPFYLENPTTSDGGGGGTVDQSSDIITPTH